MEEHEADCAIAQSIMVECPEAYDVMPADVVIGFVNCFRSEKKHSKRKDVTLAAIRANLEWALKLDYKPYDIGECFTTMPARRAEFEEWYSSGPIGSTSEGRAVMLERIGSIPAHQFCKEVSPGEMIRQVIFSRQAALAWNRALSAKHGKNLRKATIIIDMKGLSTLSGHLSREFLAIAKRYVQTLLNVFPEAADGFHVINAPTLFRAAYTVIRPLLDAETIAKCRVLGGPAAYEPAFAQMGIKTDDGRPIVDCRPAWLERLREMRSMCVGSTGNGHVPPAPYLTETEAKVYASGLSARRAVVAEAATNGMAKLSEAKVLPLTSSANHIGSPYAGKSTPTDGSTGNASSPVDVRANVLLDAGGFGKQDLIAQASSSLVAPQARSGGGAASGRPSINANDDKFARGVQVELGVAVGALTSLAALFWLISDSAALHLLTV